MLSEHRRPDQSAPGQGGVSSQRADQCSCRIDKNRKKREASRTCNQPKDGSGTKRDPACRGQDHHFRTNDKTGKRSHGIGLDDEPKRGEKNCTMSGETIGSVFYGAVWVSGEKRPQRCKAAYKAGESKFILEGYNTQLHHRSIGLIVGTSKIREVLDKQHRERQEHESRTREKPPGGNQRVCIGEHHKDHDEIAGCFYPSFDRNCRMISP